jgi:hypothetical protein
MDRRTFNKLAGLAALGALADVEMSAAQAASVTGEVVLEDNALMVAFDPGTGALTRMEYKTTNWNIERRPALGVSFRMFAPLPKQRYNPILGQKQRAKSVEKISANQVRLVWSDLMSEHGGVLPIAFTATVTLKHGELYFDGVVDNQSDLHVETIDYPYFGDLNPPTPETRMVVEHMFVGALSNDEIYPSFANALGYWGVWYPTKTFGTERSQFCLIQTPERGIYVAQQDPAVRYLLQFTFEQHPGTIDWNSNAVPRSDEISRLPVHLDFRCCHFPFVHPKSSVTLSTVAIRPYEGDWHAGLDVYREWRETWFGNPHIPEWVKDVNSWQQLQIDGAEQDYSIPYRELIKYGTECAENGVGAIQLVGWNKGGQDGGDPCMSTDPGLGTWQELHDAIAQIQAKGVRMILFGKPVFADMSTDWYKEVLYQYECTDMWGNKYESGGYSYDTPTQLAGINNRRRAIMDVCCQEYRDIATHEFEKTLALGAQGWLFDEVMQHNGVLYNFNANHGYEPPGYLFSADIPLVKQFRAAADKVNRDFLFSGEGPCDWEMPYYVLGYYRIGWGTRHALRYIDPQAPLMAAVRGWDARDEINCAMLYRYILEYEPYNFKGSITAFPMTLEYGKKVDGLRRKYKAWIWDAEFRDNLGADVTADGSVRYTVYRKADGKRAVMIANLEQEKPIAAKLNLPNAGTLKSATPEEQELKSFSGTAQIPARSVVVVMEQ